MKKILMMAVMMMSTSAFAQSPVADAWCSATRNAFGVYVITTDIVDVLRVKGGKYRKDSIGAETGSIHSSQRGFISGGSSLDTDMKDSNGNILTYMQINKRGRILTLEYGLGGAIEKYKKCAIRNFEI